MKYACVSFTAFKKFQTETGQRLKQFAYTILIHPNSIEVRYHLVDEADAMPIWNRFTRTLMIEKMTKTKTKILFTTEVD